MAQKRSTEYNEDVVEPKLLKRMEDNDSDVTLDISILSADFKSSLEYDCMLKTFSITLEKERKEGNRFIFFGEEINRKHYKTSASDRKTRLFYNLERFLRLAYRLSRHRHMTGNYAPPIHVLRELTSINQYPIAALNELFFLLRDAAFAYKRPTQKQPPSSGTRLFKDEWLTDWQRKKVILKRRIKKHMKYYQPLRDLHKYCLRSQADEEACRSNLEKAKETLKNFNMHGSEYDQQVALIKVIANRLEKYHARLMSDLHDYTMKFRKEKARRYRMLQTAGPLEFDIVSCIRKKLTEALESIERICPGMCHLSSEDIVMISDHLYDISSKRYVFRNTTSSINTPEFKESLPRSHIQPSSVRFGHEDSTYASHNMWAAVIEDTQETDEFYLPLMKGDTVKLKIVSADKTIGFGWTKKSTFTFKRFGFFRLSNLQLLPDLE